MPRDTIVLLGVNHKTTPLAVREKLALSGGYEEPLRALGQLEELHEYYLLSTCNRVEILFTCRDVEKAKRQVLAQLFAGAVTQEELDRYIYQYLNDQAVEHLFQVAASLDSMIVGEAQILGQLKEAYRHAAKNRCSGFVLNKLLHKSFSVAKRVRTETRIGASAPLDYIIESILNPAAKVKEGYHAFSFAMKDGSEAIGIPSRETPQATK